MCIYTMIMKKGQNNLTNKHNNTQHEVTYLGEKTFNQSCVCAKTKPRYASARAKESPLAASPIWVDFMKALPI